MKKKYLFYFVIVLVACNSKTHLSKYQDSTDKYFVQVQLSQHLASEDSLLTFYDLKNPSDAKEVGFIKDGFRNGMWVYNLPSGVKKITWGDYKNKDLALETNLFEKADTMKYGNSFVRFLYKTDMGDLVLSIFINGSLKDSFPETNYRQITEREFSKLGIETLSFKTFKIDYTPNNIYVSDIEAMEKSNNKTKILKTAFSFIDKNTFVEFSVISSRENVYREILFNAVLTNLFVNGKRLYYPFKKDW
jgi:hypothetical protein